ncbi:MAG: sugar ABC transporter substrate-binding protein [Bacillota bacterium]|nr:sugar ABC transporter substrate-binding protein [Bacillota bacterium]
MRRFLSVATVALTLSLLVANGVAAAPLPPSKAKINWRQFEGQSITVLMVAHPWQKAVEPLIPQFEKLTGIKVNVVVQAEDLFWDRSQLGMSSPNPPFDVTYLAMGINGLTAYKNGWLEPLDEYLNNPKLTDKNWFEFDDFFPADVAGFRMPKPDQGKVYGIPMAGEVYLNFYRKDLFKQHGIDVRKLKTMDDWLKAVKSLNLDTNKDGKTDIYGATIRGANAGIIDELNAMVADYWGDAPYQTDRFVYFDENWRPRFTDPRIVAAFATWGELMKNSAPGVTSFDWYECTTQFAQGRAATYWADASLFASIFEDPKQSAVVGKVGYAPLPATKNGHNTALFTWGLAIPARSKHKGPAWLFIQWATSQAIDLEVSQKTFASPRKSTWDNPTFKKALPEGLGEAVAASLAVARPSIMYVDAADKVILRMLDALHAIALGTPAEKAMQKLQDEATQIVKEAGLYK